MVEIRKWSIVRVSILSINLSVKIKQKISVKILFLVQMKRSKNNYVFKDCAAS